ncbi:hypothetical protein QZH41_011933 [Actinostola sp. cb2023]|nr:hypothetical protein QZH41_011933 [Actinostola sp. cb2023]
MSKVCMAAVNENDKTFSTKRLQERFPEIPETVIAKILTQHAYNMEKCITILTQESDRYLYGESSDGPVVTLPQSTLEPLSIQIPPQPASDLATNYYVRDSPRTPRDRATTVGIASSGGATAVPGTQGDRHHQVDEYSRKLIPHQQQRLERLIKEVELEKQKLFELQSLVSIKQEEIMNKNFRVAGNPSKTDVDHLEEETQVLREEIDQMSHEIDSIKCSNYKGKKMIFL